jgi:hypothetical protein
MDDPDLQKELNELLNEQEKRLGERNARDQAVAANTILALMGDLDFATLTPELRERRIYDVFTYASYAIAGLPAVQNAMAFVCGGDLNEAERVEGIVRALGMAFCVDPEPLLVRMLGLPAGSAAPT